MGFYNTELAVEAVDWNVVFIAHHVELDEAFAKTELSLLMFFISLFILVGGVEHSQFLQHIGSYILPFVQQDLLVACLVLTPLWWALAVGVGMGGNGTHLGSTANVFIVTISERFARETGNPAYRITPGLWFKKGSPVMVLTLFISTIIFYMFFDFYANPLPSYSQWSSGLDH